MSGDSQHPQEQAAFVGRVFKGAPSARQHAQDEEAQRLPEAAAEQEEMPFARLSLRQVPQGRLSPAAVGVQEFPRGARSRGGRMEPAGGPLRRILSAVLIAITYKQQSKGGLLVYA